jgi:hypothetical protein
MLAPRMGYGPAGLANDIYGDPYSWGSARAAPAPSALAAQEAPTTARRRRIPLPPHDPRACAPHPSGSHLGRSGTWRTGNSQRFELGVADARSSMASLFRGTEPEPPPDSSVTFPVQRSMLSLADGSPHHHTETVGPRRVHRAAAWASPTSHREAFARTQRSSHASDGSLAASFLVRCTLQHAPQRDGVPPAHTARPFVRARVLCCGPHRLIRSPTRRHRVMCRAGWRMQLSAQSSTGRRRHGCPPTADPRSIPMWRTHRTDLWTPLAVFWPCLHT